MSVYVINVCVTDPNLKHGFMADPSPFDQRTRTNCQRSERQKYRQTGRKVFWQSYKIQTEKGQTGKRKKFVKMTQKMYEDFI